MPAYTLLRVGDRIRLLRVPENVLRTRDWEIHDGLEDAGGTADTFERILRQDPVVTINRIDEYGQPWFDDDLKVADGNVEEHTIAIHDSDSWEMA